MDADNLFANKIFFIKFISTLNPRISTDGADKNTLLEAIRTVLFDRDKRGREITGFLVWEDRGSLALFLFFMEEKRKIETEVKASKGLPDDFNLIYYLGFLDKNITLRSLMTARVHIPIWKSPAVLFGTDSPFR